MNNAILEVLLIIFLVLIILGSLLALAIGTHEFIKSVAEDIEDHKAKKERQKKIQQQNNDCIEEDEE